MFKTVDINENKINKTSQMTLIESRKQLFLVKILKINQKSMSQKEKKKTKRETLGNELLVLKNDF